MESFFGTIDHLNRNIDHKSLLSDRAVRKIAGAGDPVKALWVMIRGLEVLALPQISKT